MTGYGAGARATAAESMSPRAVLQLWVVQKDAIDKIVEDHPEVLESVIALLKERREQATAKLFECGAVEGLVDEVGEGLAEGDGAVEGERVLSEVELMHMFLQTKNELATLDVATDGEDYVAKVGNCLCLWAIANCSCLFVIFCVFLPVACERLLCELP